MTNAVKEARANTAKVAKEKSKAKGKAKSIVKPKIVKVDCGENV